MRVVFISLIISIVLSACNMTAGQTAADADVEQLNVSALATTTPSNTGSGTSTDQTVPESSDPKTTNTTQQTGTTNTVQQPNTTTQQQTNTSTTFQQSRVTSASTVCNSRPGWQTYYVKAGDTLSRIAQAVGVSTDELALANCLQDANALNVGQGLLVPYVPASVPSSGSSNPPSLRRVGDFMGTPGMESCWVSNPGSNPLVYDAVNGTPIAVLGNRLVVLSAQGREWLQVPLEGTKTIPESIGWMRTADVSLLGSCTEVTGVPLISFRGLQFGNPAGTPTHICGVSTTDPNASVSVYDQPGGNIIGSLIGWGVWVSTEGAYHQIHFDGFMHDMRPSEPMNAWVSVNWTIRVNC